MIHWDRVAAGRYASAEGYAINRENLAGQIWHVTMWHLTLNGDWITTEDTLNTAKIAAEQHVATV
jgi:hypothetical protein